MYKWFLCLLGIGITVYATSELVRWWPKGGASRGWIDLAATYGGMLTVVIVLFIADARSSKTPTDAPEVDYADPVEPSYPNAVPR